MKRHARVSTLLILFLSLLVFTRCQSPSPLATQTQVVVTVDATSVQREIQPGLVLGANLGSWVLNPKLGPQTQGLFKDLRPSVVRFPGGNMSNNYCWVTQRASDNNHVQWDSWNWGTSVAQYVAFLKAIGCVPMFSLNPFDHTIDGQVHSAVSEASELAGLFVANGFTGAYYEVGNENDGSWNPMLSISDYTDRFIQLTTAVKAVDTAAQSMGPVVSSYNPTWVNGFLDSLQSRGALGLLDWLSYHHYGGWIANANQDKINLNDPQAFGQGMETIRSALAAHGASRVKIAVTEMNAAIWGEGCTRDQFTINQGIWLADTIGACFLHADAANVWIHLSSGTDPHSLINDATDPPTPTRNYWPVCLAAQTLSTESPSTPVSVLAVTVDTAPSIMTAYAVRKSDGSLGILLMNKGSQDLEVAIALTNLPLRVAGRLISQKEYEAASGPEPLSVRIEWPRLICTVPGLSIAGLRVF